MADQAVYNLLRKRAEQGVVKAISPHDLRRSFVSDLRSYDSMFLNLELPHDGTYYLRVTAPYASPDDTGSYEMLSVLDSYHMPEPGTAAMLLSGLLILILRRRLRKD